MTHHIRDKASRIYSLVFSVLVLIISISFLNLQKFNLSAISENFHWRRELINFYTSFRLNIGDSVYSNAIIGKNGWIFYTGDRSIAGYQNIDALNNKKLMNFKRKLDSLNADLKARGITLLVVIPPNKSTIYPQYMPNEIPVLGQRSSLDQFVDYMKSNGDAFILDLRPVLLDAGRSQAIYYKTDTHWNDLGAYYGYIKILRALELDYPLLTPRPLSDFKYTYVGDSVRDLPLLMGLSKHTEENWILIPSFANQLEESKIALPDGRYIRTVINTDRQLPKLLVFGDSFYDSLAHFIEPHFSTVKTIPFKYEKGIWSLDWIQRENPDIVIIEIVERYIDISLPILLKN